MKKSLQIILAYEYDFAMVMNMFGKSIPTQKYMGLQKNMEK